MRVSDVPDPQILNPRDAIVRVTATAICGSDLHLYDGYIPTMKEGDILGHEFMGEVVEVGRAVDEPARSATAWWCPFAIACGGCFFCKQRALVAVRQLEPQRRARRSALRLLRRGPVRLLAHDRRLRRRAGGVRARAVRRRRAAQGPDDLTDEQVLFLSDIFPTGYMAAENCNIEPGDTVAVWGCGPVGQFAIRSACLLGAERVIAIDRVPERLRMAASGGGADVDRLRSDERRDRAPDGDDRRPRPRRLHRRGGAGGARHGARTRSTTASRPTLLLATDRPTALRQAIQACRKGGTVSIPGVYGGLLDKIPLGAAFAKGLTFKMGQTHVHRYLRPLLEAGRGRARSTRPS